MKKHGLITDKVFESVDVKDSFVPMLIAAITWTAAPQSTDATEAIHPIVFESMTQVKRDGFTVQSGKVAYSQQSRRGDCGIWGKNRCVSKNKAVVP